jgi:hypothetical protein
MKQKLNQVWFWIKTHKLVTVLILVILYFLFKDSSIVSPLSYRNNKSVEYEAGGSYGSSDMMLGAPASSVSNFNLPALPISREAPPSETKDRMVVTNTSLSLLVNNVRETLKAISTYAQSKQGYMVESNVYDPQYGSSGSITVRIPTSYLDESMEYFRSLGVRVVSENVQGTDVTDQYEDTEEKLRILQANKTRFEEIMNSAVKIDDILKIQKEIFNLQSQIDALKGSQKYLEQTSKLAKVTIFLSTDELALPYQPNEIWRPEVVFKQAVRSLIGSLRDVANIVIWIAVYALVIIPVLLIIFLILHWRKKRV